MLAGCSLTLAIAGSLRVHASTGQPAAMPQSIVDRLHDEIVRILNSPEVRAKAEDIGFPVATSTPEELSATIRRDIEYTAKIVKAVGIRPE